MYKLPIGISVVAISQILVGPAAFGEVKASPFSLSLKAGLEYDSRLSVDALDTSALEGDTSARLAATAGYKLYENDGAKIQADYGFLQTIHFDTSDFDIQMHRGGLTAKNKFRGSDIAANYSFSHTALDGDALMAIHSVRPSIGRLVGGKFYLTGDYEYQNQDFKQLALETRNADRHSVGTGVIYILGKGKSLNAGLQLSDHDADLGEFDFQQTRFSAGFKLPVLPLGENAKFSVRYRYRMRDYSEVTPSIGEIREDTRHSARARLDVPIFDLVTARLQYEYTSSTSNLPSADYDNQNARLIFIWKL